MKTIRIFVSKLGRKNEYIGMYGKKEVSYPVVYFRKSKFCTDDEYKMLLKHIFEKL